MRIVTLLALCAALLYCSQGNQQEECLKQHIHLPVIKGMLNNLLHILKSLPRDNEKSKKFLGKVAKCTKKHIKETDNLYKLLEIYEEHIFQKLWKNTIPQMPKIFMDNFSRLKNDLEHCVNRSQTKNPSCANRYLKNLELKFKMLQQQHLFKAVSEFHKVLAWISFAMDRKRTPEKN